MELTFGWHIRFEHTVRLYLHTSGSLMSAKNAIFIISRQISDIMLMHRRYIATLTLFGWRVVVEASFLRALLSLLRSRAGALSQHCTTTCVRYVRFRMCPPPYILH